MTDCKERIENEYKEAMRCLKMLRPQEINDKLQYYAGLYKALIELRRLALNEPNWKCKK